ncbi:MAG: type VI secretion system tip protein VgrG [Chthoniobacterales bacterium]|nr:type VI secretion system tip protein VgrG [Chthoniobacterales bacterium]
MSVNFTQANRPITLTTPLGKDVLLLQKIFYREALNSPFCLQIWARSTDFTIQPKDILGKSATVSIDLPRGGKRYINGIVRSFCQENSSSLLANYRLEVVPWLKLLELGTDCAIYQKQTVPQILSDLINSLGYRNQVQFKLLTNYNTRGVCVQYRESYLNFINRLCEKEGIFYFFAHTDRSHTLIFGDDNSTFQTFGLYSELNYFPLDAPDSQEYFFKWNLEAELLPGKVTLLDYDFLAPKKFLQSTAISSSETDFLAKPTEFENFDYPGGFEVQQNVSHYANMQQQSHQAAGQILEGEAFCLGLCAGSKICLTNFPNSTLSTDYIITATELTAQNADYITTQLNEKEAFRCKFRAIPAKVPYRPPHRSNKPIISGVQTAVVTGPSEQNPKVPYVSEFGSIKVQFHWDRAGQKNDKSSGWVRVAQIFAGEGYGAMICPRLGNEVVVAFEEGDPDRPIVIGSLYNADNLPALPLPKFAQRCYITDDGGNAICMSPENGCESIVLYSPFKNTMKVVGASDKSGYQNVPTLPGLP